MAGQLATALEDVLARCRVRWPGVAAEGPDEAVRRLAVTPSKAEEPLHLDDLWLASACRAGNRAALGHFDRDFLARSLAGVARLDPCAAFADEVSQSVRERLFTDSTGGSRLAGYTGRGPLLSWVRAVAMRCALNLRRGKHQESEEPLLGISSIGDDPELQLLRSRFGAEFKEALGAALRSLDPQERSFLRLHLVEGVTIDRLAASSGVHRSTVVRRLAAARGNVLRKTRARLATTLRVEPSEVDSLIGLLQSRLDLSLGRLLQSAAALESIARVSRRGR